MFFFSFLKQLTEDTLLSTHGREVTRNLLPHTACVFPYLSITEGVRAWFWDAGRRNGLALELREMDSFLESNIPLFIFAMLFGDERRDVAGFAASCSPRATSRGPTMFRNFGVGLLALSDTRRGAAAMVFRFKRTLLACIKQKWLFLQVFIFSRPVAHYNLKKTRKEPVMCKNNGTVGTGSRF